jgi:hypothetical protein
MVRFWILTEPHRAAFFRTYRGNLTVTSWRTSALARAAVQQKSPVGQRFCETKNHQAARQAAPKRMP